jgi:malate dehydrogenase (oxaloacetate-decarboxylating)
MVAKKWPYYLNKIKEDAINVHRALRGKIEIHNRVSIDTSFGEEKGTLGLIILLG